MKQEMDFDGFVELVYATQDKELLRDLLYSVTSTSERHEIPRRIEVIKRLLRGHTQPQIAAELKVGLATITRGSKELSQGHFRLLREQK